MSSHGAFVDAAGEGRRTNHGAIEIVVDVGGVNARKREVR
jgi:hypothetical protein